MANTIQYVYSAINNFTPTTNAINASLTQVAATAATTGNRFTRMARSIRGSLLGANGAVSQLSSQVKGLIVTMGAFVGAREFFQTGISFQNTMLDVSSITGATGEDLEFLRQQSLLLAKDTATSATEVGNSFKLVASAKSELLSDPGGLVEVNKQILILKNATGDALDETANALLGALNQFGAGADEAARFSNVLAAGSKIGASEVGDTAIAIEKAGVAANVAGLSFEELNSAIQVLAKNGQKGALSGTNLKTAILALETSGIKQIQPSVVGFVQALKNVRDANLDAEQTVTLFGRSAFTVGGTLTKNADLVDEWTNAVTATSVAQEQADIRMKSFAFRLKSLGVSIQDSLIKVFDKLEPKMGSMVSSFNAWFDSITKEDVDAFVSSMMVLLDVASLIAKAFASVLSVLKSIGVVIGETAAAVSTVNFGQFTADEEFERIRTFTKAIKPLQLAFEVIKPRSLVDNAAVPGSGNSKSAVDLNINVTTPTGVDVTTDALLTSGGSLNVGVNQP